MRRFVVLGRTATASPDFSLDDLAGTSGRLDVLTRCLRAALLVSNGVRRDVVIYLVLLGGPRAPRVVRLDGATARWVRPEERHLATTVQKALANASEEPGFTVLRNGFSIANGGLEVVLADLPPGPRFVLDAHGEDVRDARLDAGEPTFFVGDHLGLEDEARAAIGASTTLSLGPLQLHADDAISILHNELDRRGALQPRLAERSSG